jgi:hypothetical protein
MDFPTHMMSGTVAGVVHSPERAGTAHAGLDLVRDEERAVSRAQLPRARQVHLGRHDAAGLSLYRLDHEAGDRCPHLRSLGELGLQGVRVAVRHESDVLEAAGERFAERGFAHERERPHGLAVKPAECGDEQVSAGVEPRQLDRALDGVGAVVDEEGVAELPGRHHREQPGQRRAPRLQQLLTVQRHALHLAGDRAENSRVVHPRAEDPVPP